MEIIGCNLGEKDDTSPIIFNYECEVYENDGSIKFHHVTFRNNSNYLKSGCFSRSKEDAIICSSFEMKDVNFYNNTSSGLVIGQLLPLATMSEVTLSNNTFIDLNITENAPGAFMLIPRGHEVYVDNINAFDNNGTIFYLNNSMIEISDSKFENNTGNYSLPVVVNSENGLIDVQGSIFSNSSAAFISIYNQSRLEVQSCTFEYIHHIVNVTVNETRAIYASNSSIIIDNSIFNYNDGDDTGGGISTADSNVTVENTYFTNNTAGYGGAIYSRCDYVNCQMDIKSSYFEDNKANIGYGGAVRVYGSMNVTIDDCEFIGNEVSAEDAYGGGIGVQSQGNTPYYITNSIFKYNHANADGGAICFNTCPECFISIEIESCVFENNTASDGNGGGIAYFVPTNTSIVDSVFSYNYASDYGGGIHIYSDGASNLYIYNSTFFKNAIDSYYGGGCSVATIAGTILSKVENCYFEENSANSGKNKEVIFKSNTD